MNTQRPVLAFGLAVLTLAACGEPVESPRIAGPSFAQAGGAQDDENAVVVTIDHWVSHVSTVPANQGEPVRLFVRERVRSDPGDGTPRKAVLMIHGVSVPVLPGMELKADGYDWALWLARSGGFDVFMLDFQGSGLSPRPMMDDPCNVPAAQQGILIPNPLSSTCPPSYPYQLINSKSDWDELDAVVDYIRALRGVERVSLVSWSQGAMRVGPYAVQHPDKVESLLLYAPFYNPAGRAGSGPDGFAPPVALPQPGTPMTLTTRSGFMSRWDPEIRCDGQVEDGMQDLAWSAIMDSDPVGRTWGPSDGVMRVRSPFLWGWNSAIVARLTVPALIIGGEFDTNVPATWEQLYNTIPHAHKLLFTVQCAGHFLVWERQRKALHHVSKDWLKDATVDGRASGVFVVDTEGVSHPR